MAKNLTVGEGRVVVDEGCDARSREVLCEARAGMVLAEAGDAMAVVDELPSGSPPSMSVRGLECAVASGGGGEGAPPVVGLGRTEAVWRSGEYGV